MKLDVPQQTVGRSLESKHLHASEKKEKLKARKGKLYSTSQEKYTCKILHMQPPPTVPMLNNKITQKT